MQTVTIEATRGEARRKYVEYRKAVQDRKKGATEAQRKIIKQDEALRRGYLELARGYKVLDLVASLRFAGCFPSGLPKLAIMRADVERVVCQRSPGELRYLPWPNAWMQRGKGLKPQFKFDGSLLMDPPIAPGREVSGRAMVPSIPPSLRPPHSFANYYILWEAVWEVLAPRDPMLLRPLGNNLYAVVAVWDLTDLERAVLNARVER